LVSEFQKTNISQLGGLGFQHEEIAQMLGLSPRQVAYYLHEFKKRSSGRIQIQSTST